MYRKPKHFQIIKINKIPYYSIESFRKYNLKNIKIQKIKETRNNSNIKIYKSLCRKCKILLKDPKVDQNKWKGIPCL